MPTYEIRSLDVWGNPEDGYEVNDSWRCGSIEIADNATDAQIVRALQDVEYLNRELAADFFTVDASDDSMISIDRAEDGKPILQLGKEE